MRKQLLLIITCLVLGGCSGPSETPTAATQDDSPNVSADDTSGGPAKPEPQTQQYSDGAIRVAAHDGNKAIVLQGIAQGNDLWAQDEQGLNTLHMAAYNGHSEIVAALLEKKPKVDLRDGTGKTALFHASSGDFAETVQLLLDAGANVNLADSDEGFTPLMVAAAEGQLEVVQLLIKHGADATMQDIDGDNALSFAMQRQHRDVVGFLMGISKDQQKGSLPGPETE